LLFGAGCILSLAFVLADRVVDDHVSQSLEHSSQTARRYGENFAHDFQEELDRFVPPLRRVLSTDPDLSSSLDLVRGLLLPQTPNSLFSEGVFVLDRHGHTRFVAAGGHHDVVGGAAPRELLDLAVESSAAWSRLEDGSGQANGAVSVIVPIAHEGEVLGYFGGIAPTSDLIGLLALRSGQGLADQQATLGLNGGWRAGSLVGENPSSATLSCLGDRDPALGGLICGNDVIAYASAPTYGVVIILKQPVEVAFASAYSLRKQLLWLAALFTAVFVLLAGLSMMAVVRPVRNLTRSLKTLEESDSAFLAEKSRGDEVGALARAMSGWHERMAASVDEADSSRAALEQEVDAARRHLEILRWVLGQATDGADLIEVVDRALSRSHIVTGLSVGAVAVRRGGKTDHRQVGVSAPNAMEVIGRARAAATRADDEVVGSGGIAGCVDVSDQVSAHDRALKTLAYVAVSDLASGVHVEAVFGDAEVKTIPRLWIESLVNHIALCLASVELREAAAERQLLQKQYLQRVLHAQEDERRRVARDLHDTVAQDLAAHRLDIERILAKQPESEHSATLKRFETRAGEMLATVRSILMNLRLSVLEEMGLIAAIRWDLAREQEKHGVRCTLIVDGEDAKVDYDRSILLFRILQESVHNAIVHGKPENIFATINVKTDSIELLVEDDGLGFDLAEIKGPGADRAGRGLGILGMEERAHLLQGVLDIRSEPGEGTSLRVSVPHDVGDLAVGRGFESNTTDAVDDGLEL